MSKDWLISSEGTKLCDLVKKKCNGTTGAFWCNPKERVDIQRVAGSYACRAGRKVTCRSFPAVVDDMVWYIVFIEVNDA